MASRPSTNIFLPGGPAMDGMALKRPLVLTSFSSFAQKFMCIGFLLFITSRNHIRFTEMSQFGGYVNLFISPSGQTMIRQYHENKILGYQRFDSRSRAGYDCLRRQ